MNGDSRDTIDSADSLWPRQWAKVLEPSTLNKWGFGPWKRPISTFSGWKLNDFSEEISQTQKRLAYWLGKGESSDGFNEVRALWCNRYLDYLREHSEKTEHYEKTYGQRDVTGLSASGQFPTNRIQPMPINPWRGQDAFITKRAREESLSGKAKELDWNAEEASPIVFTNLPGAATLPNSPEPSQKARAPYKPPRKKRRVGQNEMRWLAEVDLTCPSPMPDPSEDEDGLLQHSEDNRDSSESEEE